MVDIVVPPVNFVFNIYPCAVFRPLVVIDIHVSYSLWIVELSWSLDMGLVTELSGSLPLSDFRPILWLIVTVDCVC